MDNHAMRRGFTLIELLVVIAILALLMGMATMNFGNFMSRGREKDTETRIQSLLTLLDQYRTLKGDYPSPRLADYTLKAPNNTNEGIEALVTAFLHKNYDGEGIPEKWLLNTDADRVAKSVTKFENPEVFEVVDAWDNPMVYLRYDSYGSEYEYEFRNTTTDEVELVRVKAEISDKTGTFYDKQKFQLRSAGSDGVFGTDDDLTSY